MNNINNNLNPNYYHVNKFYNTNNRADNNNNNINMNYLNYLDYSIMYLDKYIYFLLVFYF